MWHVLLILLLIFISEAFQNFESLLAKLFCIFVENLYQWLKWAKDPPKILFWSRANHSSHRIKRSVQQRIYKMWHTVMVTCPLYTGDYFPCEISQYYPFHQLYFTDNATEDVKELLSSCLIKETCISDLFWHIKSHQNP